MNMIKSLNEKQSENSLDYLVEHRKIKVNELQQLRGTTGWAMLEDYVVEKAL